METGVDGSSLALFLRKDAVAARILRRWRALTGGKGVRDVDRRTLVACSGGADSVLLAAVLCSVNPKAVVGHVVHDLRNNGSAMRDRDAVERLAMDLGCGYVERRVSVRSAGGNDEANARRLRYLALGEMADEVGAGYVATGHHGDDQLETVLMRMMRGTGVRGLRGIGERVEMDGMGGMVVVRPMLGVSRAEIEGVCASAGLGWVHDATNDDVGYLRNRIRHSVLPTLREIEPGLGAKVAGMARSCWEVNDFLEEYVFDGIGREADRDGQVWSWDRDRLRCEHGAVLGELMFMYVDEALGGIGADSMGRRAVEGGVLAIKSEGTDPCVHRVGPIVVDVTARRVVFSPAMSSERSMDGANERMNDE